MSFLSVASWAAQKHDGRSGHSDTPWPPWHVRLRSKRLTSGDSGESFFYGSQKRVKFTLLLRALMHTAGGLLLLLSAANLAQAMHRVTWTTADPARDGHRVTASVYFSNDSNVAPGPVVTFAHGFGLSPDAYQVTTSPCTSRFRLAVYCLGACDFFPGRSVCGGISSQLRSGPVLCQPCQGPGASNAHRHSSPCHTHRLFF